MWVLISEEKDSVGGQKITHTRTRRFYCSRCRETVDDIDFMKDGTYRLTRREFGLNELDKP